MPPLLTAHGDQDTYVSPEHARRFVERLRRAATNPVVHIELPGAQHSFEPLHSIRFETLIDGIEAFAATAHRNRSGFSRAVSAGCVASRQRRVEDAPHLLLDRRRLLWPLLLETPYQFGDVCKLLLEVPLVLLEPGEHHFSVEAATA